jgi:hypothetical protein
LIDKNMTEGLQEPNLVSPRSSCSVFTKSVFVAT